MNEPEGKERCPDAQLLAAFSDGNLRRSEVPVLLAHLETCERCTSALEAASALREPEGARQPRERRTLWLAAAAAVVVLLLAVPLARRALETNPTDHLVGLAPRSARVVEPRLAGGFAWAPYRGPERSSDRDAAAGRMKLVGAAGELVERANTDRTAEAQHAAGVGLLLVDQSDPAIARLREAVENDPNDTRAWSDLSAAEYTAALRHGRPSLYPVALDHANRALRMDGNFAEALFNRALILERLGLTTQAREAWQHYLRVDGSSPWANEARERLQRLPASTSESLFKHELPRLEAAVAANDDATIESIVDRYRQQSRAFAEAEYLGRWAESGAAQPLDVARAVGDALVKLSGESLLRDAVAAIDRAMPNDRATLAAAHVRYRAARIAYSRHEPAAAEPELRRAARELENGRSPMSVVARYYAASTRFDQNDAAGARRELELLLHQSPHYLAHGAQVRWALLLCTMLDEDWTATVAHAAAAERAFAQLGEKSNLAFMQAARATALISLGRADDGWALRAESFAIQSGEGRANRLSVAIGDAARVELRMGRLDAARALLDLEQTAHRAAGDDVQLSNAAGREAVLASTLGDRADADRCAREALTTATRITDPGLRARAEADARFAAGVVALDAEPSRAHGLLTQAIDHYRTTQKAFYLPEARLLRARASMRAGRREDAVRDLEEGIAELERHRGDGNGTGVLDAHRGLYGDLVPLLLDRGDVAGAFAYAERARGLACDARDLPQRLAGTGAAVLELLVLRDELVAFCVTERGLAVTRRRAKRDALTALAARDDDEAARRLYDLLIRGIVPERASQLIVVADPELQHVAFAALADRETNRHLIETMPVATALNAAALQRTDRVAAGSVVAVALPSGERVGTAALPEGVNELADVARLYGHATAIGAERASLAVMHEAAARADVLHIAGHTARQPGAGEPALLFRGVSGDVEAITWRRIASMRFRAPVVVLAACETLRAPRGANALSLGGGFLAAGASSVVGTLAPVSDNDARELFRTFHRELARGRGAAAALRHAQLEAMSARRESWRVVSMLTNRIESGGKG